MLDATGRRRAYRGGVAARSLEIIEAGQRIGRQVAIDQLAIYCRRNHVAGLRRAGQRELDPHRISGVKRGDDGIGSLATGAQRIPIDLDSLRCCSQE